MSNNPRLNKQINAFQNHETGTHYNINRDYNPVTGRYIQSDPIGFDGGVNGFGYVETNIDLNGNLLTEASKYTDADGNKELVADIQLATDVRDTHVDIEDIPNFSIDESTRLLPQLRGSGLVYDGCSNNLNYYCLIEVV